MQCRASTCIYITKAHADHEAATDVVLYVIGTTPSFKLVVYCGNFVEILRPPLEELAPKLGPELYTEVVNVKWA